MDITYQELKEMQGLNEEDQLLLDTSVTDDGWVPDELPGSDEGPTVTIGDMTREEKEEQHMNVLIAREDARFEMLKWNRAIMMEYWDRLKVYKVNQAMWKKYLRVIRWMEAKWQALRASEKFKKADGKVKYRCSRWFKNRLKRAWAAGNLYRNHRDRASKQLDEIKPNLPNMSPFWDHYRELTADFQNYLELIGEDKQFSYVPAKFWQLRYMEFNTYWTSGDTDEVDNQIQMYDPVHHIEDIRDQHCIEMAKEQAPESECSAFWRTYSLWEVIDDNQIKWGKYGHIMQHRSHFYNILRLCKRHDKVNKFRKTLNKLAREGHVYWWTRPHWYRRKQAEINHPEQRVIKYGRKKNELSVVEIEDLIPSYAHQEEEEGLWEAMLATPEEEMGVGHATVHCYA